MKSKLLFFTATLCSLTAAAETNPMVSGHVHALSSFVDTDQNGDKGDLNVTVPEATLYLQKQVGEYGVFADLPFSGSSATNAMTFDFASAGQAYVSKNSESGLSWKLGQWDSPFGVEGASAPETAFNIGGAVAAALPTVHRGVVAGYNLGGAAVELFVANPTTFLTNMPNSGSNNDKLESGLNVSIESDQISLGLGAMYGRAYQKNHWASFFNIAYAADSFNTALEIDYLNDKDVIANSNGGKILTALHVNYVPADLWNVGARAEYLKHGDASVWTATLGPKYQLYKEVSLRADYTINKRDYDFATGIKAGAEYFTHTVALGAVAQF